MRELVINLQKKVQNPNRASLLVTCGVIATLIAFIAYISVQNIGTELLLILCLAATAMLVGVAFSMNGKKSFLAQEEERLLLMTRDHDLIGYIQAQKEAVEENARPIYADHARLNLAIAYVNNAEPTRTREVIAEASPDRMEFPYQVLYWGACLSADILLKDSEAAASHYEKAKRALDFCEGNRMRYAFLLTEIWYHLFAGNVTEAARLLEAGEKYQVDDAGMQMRRLMKAMLCSAQNQSKEAVRLAKMAAKEAVYPLHTALAKEILEKDKDVCIFC